MNFRKQSTVSSTEDVEGNGGRDFHTAIVWPLPDELAVGCVRAAHVICGGKVEELPHEVFCMVENKSVLLVGSHWTTETVAKLETMSSKLCITVFSETDMNKFSGYGSSIFTMEGIFSPRDYEIYPWLHYLWNRNVPGSDKKTQKTQEAFYRGLLDFGKKRGYVEVFDLLAALCRNDLKINEDELIRYGKCIARHYRLECADWVKRHAIYMPVVWKDKLYRACIIIGGPAPVMPLVKAAAAVARIGVNVRFYASEDVTRFTFYTFQPDEVDLSFVNELPFGGGGSNECRGANLKGFLENRDALESLFTTIRPKPSSQKQ